MTDCLPIDKNRWLDILTKYCLKCVSRHLSRNWNLVLGDNENIVSYLQNHHGFDITWKTDSFENNVNNWTDSQNLNCCACSGILTNDFIQYCVSLIKNCILNEKYVFSSFKLLVFMPLSFLIQESGSSHAFKAVFNEQVVKDPFNVKELLKALLNPLLVQTLVVDRKIDSEFEISLYLNNVHADETALPELKAVSPHSFECRKKKRFFKQRKHNEKDHNQITSSQVNTALSNIKESELEKIHSLLIGPCTASVKLNHSPVFVGGRYNKYSRTLSQTPWIIDGERKLENSVEEFLAGPVQDAFHADDHHFSSSGREDVDVKMLGNGRPFMLELVNPRFPHLSESSVQELEKLINNQTTDVAVSSLQVLSKSDCQLLKEGETAKTKSYSAVCYFIEHPTDEQLDKLSSLCIQKDVTLNQCTPIRVLHRRPLATRPKVVHTMAAERLPDDPRLFRLDLVTQAGTYVKEFVHGDFGRTRPSLRDFLGADVDIIDLDVTMVNIQWPPCPGVP